MSNRDLVSIRQFLRQAPHPPILNSEIAGWPDIILLKYPLYPAGEVDAPGLAENILFMNLSSKVHHQDLNEPGHKQRVSRYGEIAVTPAGCPRHWRSFSPSTAANLCIPSPLIQTISQDLVKGDPASVCLSDHGLIAAPFLSALMFELLSELEAGSPSGKTYISSLTHSLVMHLIVNYSTAKIGVRPTLLKSDDILTSCAINFIQAHLGEDMSLAAIATACNVSINHLCATFKHSMGQSVHQYVIQRKIETAKILLKNGQRSLAEISQDIGFSNQAHFTTSFRKVCGITPGQYRQDVK